MKKLIQGIVEFRQNALSDYRERYARLAYGQDPDSLFIACSDSRVAPNAFASTNPGDLFVVRNVGNLMPKCHESGHSTADESEAAALEYAVLKLEVSAIIICGHSDCGAMHAICNGREKVTHTNLRSWLRHGEFKEEYNIKNPSNLDKVNLYSQRNVLSQIEHLKTYPFIQERLAKKKLTLHAWWFELKTANVYAYEHAENQFVLIDETEAARLMEQLSLADRP